MTLPFDDTADYDAATRGFLGTLEPPIVYAADGRVVWDLDSYSFLEGEAPETVNPSLWRQSQLLTKHGLFEVIPGIYQVRGFDLSVMTLIEGDTGVVVIDPLISCETAAEPRASPRRPTSMPETFRCSPPRASWSMRSPRTSTRAPRWHAERATCTAQSSSAGRWDRSVPAWARPPPPEPSRSSLVATATAAYDDGDLRWAAEILSHVVFAAPDHAEGRALLAQTLEQLGYGSENGTWRCAYLSGAHELRQGGFGAPISPMSGDVLAALTPAQLFDSMAVRVNGPRCWEERLDIDLDLGADGCYRLRLGNGVLTHSVAAQTSPAELTLRMPKTALPSLASGPLSPTTLEDLGVQVEGDLGAVARVLAALDAPDPDFAIVRL